MRIYFYLAVAVATASFGLFHLLCSRAAQSRRALLFSSLIIATPACAIVINYRFGVPGGEWFINLRAIPGTETLIGLLGAPLAVVLASRRLNGLRYGDHARLVSVGLVIICIVGVFLPELLGAMDYSRLSDKWDDGVCLQTSNSTCVPACLATLLRMNGKQVSERELAEAIGTTTVGTDDWYILRGLRRFGYEAHFGRCGSVSDAPVPSVLCVVTPNGIPHVVVLLRKGAKTLTIGEPLTGKLTYDRGIFEQTYRPDGSFITVTPVGR